MSWTVVLALALGTFLLKNAGLALAARWEMSNGARAAAALVPAALFAALAALGTLGGSAGWTLDARAFGVALAAVALWRGASFPWIVGVAVAGTALMRLASSAG